MNSDELQYYLNCIVGPRPVDVYVIASNEFHKVNYGSNRTIVICSNTMPDKHVGLHCVMFVLQPFNGKKIVTYFDSYGMSLSYYGMQVPFKIQFRNKMSLQNSFSSYCGHYVLFVTSKLIIERLSLKKILKKFGNNTYHNDEIVSQFVSKLSRRCNVTHNHNNIDKMCCEIKYNVLKHYNF